MGKYSNIIGNKVLEYRAKSGLSQKALAKILGVNQTTVSLWESQNYHPRSISAVRLIQHFDCTFEDLFTINTK